MDILERRSYGATVDKSKNKSIRLSDGSLKRDIDVIPARWTDNVTYQSSRLYRDRGVYILDKSVPTNSMCPPFPHIDRLDTDDRGTGSGPKVAIRLLKNIKADSSRRIELSSYDVTDLMWNATH